MDIKEAAKTLGVSTKTLRRYIKKGSLEARKGSGQGGQAWDIPESSLRDLKEKLQSGVVSPTIEKLDKGGQPGASLVKVDTSGHLSLDIGHKLTAHMSNIRMGEPGTHIDELPSILTVEEVARYLRVGVATVREYIKSGKLRSVKLGRGWKVSRRSLEAFEKKLLG